MAVHAHLCADSEFAASVLEIWLWREIFQEWLKQAGSIRRFFRKNNELEISLIKDERTRKNRMSVTDTIADMLTRIRNGCKARKRSVDIPSSRMKCEIGRILLEENYIKDMVEIPDNKQGIIRVFLRYNHDDNPVISGIQRISRPGLRSYVGSGEVLRKGRYGMGLTVVSTSSGVMTNRDAYRKGVGGELLFRVW